jgi:hypothetical protein
MWRLSGGIIFNTNFPINFQNWQYKAPTLIPQLPLWGKITDRFMMEENYL